MKRQERRPLSWLVPVALTTIGAVGWACTELPEPMGLDMGSTTADIPMGTTTTGPTTMSATTSATSTGVADVTASDGSEVDDEAAEDESGPPPMIGSDPEATRRDVLTSIAFEVMVPNTAEFARLAAELQVAADAYAAAAADDPSAAAVQLAEAQAAWRAAMHQFQRLESMQLGPAASSVTGIAGEGLRDELYSWPTTDTCTVDRRVVDEAYLGENFILLENVLAYGLDALEYLLFSHDMAHSCAPQVGLDGPWNGLGFATIEQRRAAYAAALCGEISRQATELEGRWSDEFAAHLADPGASGSPWTDETTALNDVFRAMFYVDKSTKDRKLALPLGILGGCTGTCPDLLESPYSGASASAVAANLEGLRELMLGGPTASSTGFDDLLAAAGQQALAVQIIDEIDGAIAAAEAFEQPLQQELVNNPPGVVTLHDEVKDVTDLLKGPFVMTLMLTIPAEGASDND